MKQPSLFWLDQGSLGTRLANVFGTTLAARSALSPSPLSLGVSVPGKDRVRLEQARILSSGRFPVPLLIKSSRSSPNSWGYL